MNLVIPSSVLTANQDVLGSMRRASSDATLAKLRFDGAEQIPAGTSKLVDSALSSAQQAVAGVEALGSANLLDGTFQRYALHSVRHLQDAADMLARPGERSKEAMGLLAQTLFDAEVTTRLGTQAGERSLSKPSPKALERAAKFADGSDRSGGGPAWVDGQWLDELGNPARGGGSDSGPDGIGSGWDGNDRGGDDYGGDGGFTGPDGETYTGI